MPPVRPMTASWATSHWSRGGGSTDITLTSHSRHQGELGTPIILYQFRKLKKQQHILVFYCASDVHKCPESGLWFVVFIDLIIYCTTKSLLGNIYTNKQEKVFSYSYHSFSSSYYSSVKNFPATSQSSSSQTTEPIVKCHTILEMGSHDLSQHAFRSGPPFWKGAQKGV